MMIWSACSDFNCMISWLDHWQTLISGIGAIGAAGLSIHFLKQQINQSAIQEEDRRLRRLTAARARMQIRLSEIIQYSNDAINVLKPFLKPPEDPYQSPYRKIGEIPIIPESALITFEEIIENTENTNFRNFIAEMISEIQVLSSRLRTFSSENSIFSLSMIHSYLMNAAKVYGYAAGMFEFARRETETPPEKLDWDLVISGLNLQNVRQSDYLDLHEFVKRAADRQNKPSAG